MIIWILIFASISTHYHLNLSTKSWDFFLPNKCTARSCGFFRRSSCRIFSLQDPIGLWLGRPWQFHDCQAVCPDARDLLRMDLEENFQKKQTMFFFWGTIFRTGEGTIIIFGEGLSPPKGLVPWWSQPLSQQSWWGLVFLGVHRFT